MITEIAAATAQLIQLVDDLLRQTSTRELAAATQRATNDVQSFKNDLLGRRSDALNLRLAGLQHGILVRLTDAEHNQLGAFSPELTALDLLGLYARPALLTLPPSRVKSFKPTLPPRPQPRALSKRSPHSA